VISGDTNHCDKNGKQTDMKLFIGLLLVTTALGQDFPRTIRLWEGNAPGAQGTEEKDIPDLTIYDVRGPGSGVGVIVCPGGGYGALAMNHEGRQVANYLNSVGITAFVLKYRLGPKYHHPVEIGDAQRAIRLVRARAAEFHVDAGKVGILGFSAGGHLASTAGTHFDAGKADATDPIDRQSSRPDFMVLGYPVISFTTPVTHKGSLKNLLGDNPDPELVKSLSSELQVTAQTPPTFLFSTSGDTAVPPENSIMFYLALHKAGVPAEIHVFEKGPHGVGLGGMDAALQEWPKLLVMWFRTRGLLK
jgi:acetyl esterase/lipase